MTRGRKPKPTAIKELTGNPGKRSPNKREPKLGGSVTMPAHLKGPAAIEWRRIIKLLDPMKLVTPADRAALAAYCTAYGRWVEAEGEVQKLGAVVKSPSGYPIQNPYLAIANKAMQQMLKVLPEFGLTPSSRSRIELPTDEKPDDGLEFKA